MATRLPSYQDFLRSYPVMFEFYKNWGVLRRKGDVKDLQMHWQQKGLVWRDRYQEVPMPEWTAVCALSLCEDLSEAKMLCMRLNHPAGLGCLKGSSCVMSIHKCLFCGSTKHGMHQRKTNDAFVCPKYAKYLTERAAYVEAHGSPEDHEQELIALAMASPSGAPRCPKPHPPPRPRNAFAALWSDSDEGTACAVGSGPAGSPPPLGQGQLPKAAAPEHVVRATTGRPRQVAERAPAPEAGGAVGPAAPGAPDATSEWPELPAVSAPSKPSRTRCSRERQAAHEFRQQRPSRPRRTEHPAEADAWSDAEAAPSGTGTVAERWEELLSEEKEVQEMHAKHKLEPITTPKPPPPQRKPKEAEPSVTPTPKAPPLKRTPKEAESLGWTSRGPPSIKSAPKLPPASLQEELLSEKETHTNPPKLVPPKPKPPPPARTPKEAESSGWSPRGAPSVKSAPKLPPELGVPARSVLTPFSQAWFEVWDEASQTLYYWNKVTNEVSWTKPGAAAMEESCSKDMLPSPAGSSASTAPSEEASAAVVVTTPAPRVDDVLGQLDRLVELLERGLLTMEEFADLKSRLLAKRI